MEIIDIYIFKLHNKISLWLCVTLMMTASEDWTITTEDQSSTAAPRICHISEYYLILRYKMIYILSV